MTFSIILTSIDRKVELARFVRSINEQRNFDISKLQIIFVDQAENAGILDKLDKRVDYHYIKYHKCSLSEARNCALPFVSNEIICFGDDDAWYDVDTFSMLSNLFTDEIDGIVISAKNEEGLFINNFPSKKQWLTYTKHCGALSISMFLRHDKNLMFDENIGVGSAHNLLSGEETDYLLCYMERHPHFKILYTPEITVRHPLAKKQNFDNYLQKNYYYARGAGYVLKKHSLPFTYKLRSFLRPLAGIFIYLFIDSFKCKKSYFLLKGRLEGYFFRQ